ncbi:hypothetical protein [Paenibacillus sp. RC84]|uniref:hypothetical protein n=1 Tax=Paenibacillus sp. RC84 TaxID=3156252 RepID=UPI003519796F
MKSNKTMEVIHMFKETVHSKERADEVMSALDTLGKPYTVHKQYDGDLSPWTKEAELWVIEEVGPSSVEEPAIETEAGEATGSGDIMLFSHPHTLSDQAYDRLKRSLDEWKKDNGYGDVPSLLLEEGMTVNLLTKPHRKEQAVLMNQGGVKVLPIGD